MGIYRTEIANLRKNIGDNIGKKIIIKETIGRRSKPQERSATIENTYSSFFRVKFDEIDRVSSYNYTDLFTGTVEVKMCSDEEYNSIVSSPSIESKKQKEVLV